MAGPVGSRLGLGACGLRLGALGAWVAWPRGLGGGWGCSRGALDGGVSWALPVLTVGVSWLFGRLGMLALLAECLRRLGCFGRSRSPGSGVPWLSELFELSQVLGTFGVPQVPQDVLGCPACPGCLVLPRCSGVFGAPRCSGCPVCPRRPGRSGGPGPSGWPRCSGPGRSGCGSVWPARARACRCRSGHLGAFSRLRTGAGVSLGVRGLPGPSGLPRLSWVLVLSGVPDAFGLARRVAWSRRTCGPLGSVLAARAARALSSRSECSGGARFGPSLLPAPVAWPLRPVLAAHAVRNVRARPVPSAPLGLFGPLRLCGLFGPHGPRAGPGRSHLLITRSRSPKPQMPGEGPPDLAHAC